MGTTLSCTLRAWRLTGACSRTPRNARTSRKREPANREGPATEPRPQCVPQCVRRCGQLSHPSSKPQHLVPPQFTCGAKPLGTFCMHSIMRMATNVLRGGKMEGPCTPLSFHLWFCSWLSVPNHPSPRQRRFVSQENSPLRMCWVALWVRALIVAHAPPPLCTLIQPPPPRPP